VDKCIGCNFYDRQVNSPADSRGSSWGQCRRMAPMLHPINQKSFMIEGVWPHVRDDDWCGEWKAAVRRPDVRSSESLSPGPLIPASPPSYGPRSGTPTPMQGGTTTHSSAASFGPLLSPGRGD
jgi:hypothetical protein